MTSISRRSNSWGSATVSGAGRPVEVEERGLVRNVDVAIVRRRRGAPERAHVLAHLRSRREDEETMPGHRAEADGDAAGRSAVD